MQTFGVRISKIVLNINESLTERQAVDWFQETYFLFGMFLVESDVFVFWFWFCTESVA